MYQKIKGTLHKLRYNNFIVNGYYDRKRQETLNKAYLGSDGYDQIMKHLADRDDFATYTNDAEERSDNFVYRHMRCHKILGCWRWKVLWQKRDLLLPVLFDEQKIGIDFGGANGPVSLHALTVDFAPVDTFNRVVKYKNLTDVEEKVDYIFSSHTLEHIGDLDAIFEDMKKILKPGGNLYFHVPAYTCVRWRSGLHTNRAFNDHAWTFHLGGDKMDEDIINPMAFDQKVAQHFKLESAEYVGDNSIFVRALNN